MDTLASERVLLRMFRESDLDAYAEMCADPEVMRYLGDGHTLPATKHGETWRLIVGHWQLRGFGLWAVEERRPGFWLAGSAAGSPRAGRAWKSAGPSAGSSGAGLCDRGRADRPLDYAFTSSARPRDQPDPAGERRVDRVALRLGMRIEGFTESWANRSSSTASSRTASSLSESTCRARTGVGGCVCREISENTKISQNSVYPSQVRCLDYTDARLETE